MNVTIFFHHVNCVKNLIRNLHEFHWTAEILHGKSFREIKVEFFSFLISPLMISMAFSESSDASRTPPNFPTTKGRVMFEEEKKMMKRKAGDQKLSACLVFS